MSAAFELSGINGVPRRYKDGDLDFFIEPKWSVDLLLDAEQFWGSVHDPACGTGTIVEACRERGILATGSDIVDRGCGAIIDFFSAPLSASVDNIISNPPYGRAEEFIRHAVMIASRKVAVLVQSKFLYSQKRHHLFTEYAPSRIYHLSNRPSMPPGELLLAGEIKAQGGKLDYCWVVWSDAWDYDPRRVTETRWLKR